MSERTLCPSSKPDVQVTDPTLSTKVVFLEDRCSRIKIGDLVRALFDQRAITALHVAKFDGAVVGYVLYASGKCSSSSARVEGLAMS